MIFAENKNQFHLLISKNNPETYCPTLYDNSKLLNKIQKKQWSLSYGIWNQLKVKQFLQNYDEVLIEQLQLNFNENSALIKQIKNISFPFLQTLQINSNGIPSLEPFGEYSFPELKTLSLRNNNITSIKSLRRSFLPKLQWIMLNGNKIKETLQMSECNMSSLKTIWLQHRTEVQNNADILQSQDLSWIVKNNAKRLQYLRINMNFRFNFLKTQTMMNKSSATFQTQIKLNQSVIKQIQFMMLNRNQNQTQNTNFYRTGQIDIQKQLQRAKNRQTAVQAKTERLTIVLKALFKAKKYQYFQSTIIRLKQYDSISQQTNLMKQYLNHCATIIQSRFKAYQARKRYQKFLPIYRRFKQLLKSVVLGWKVRRIFNLPSFKKKITQIRKNQVQGKLMNMRIMKRQLSSDIQRVAKYGLWVNQARKIPLAKENKKHVQKSIKNFFNKTIKLSQSKSGYRNSGKDSLKSEQLQKTKRISKNEIEQSSKKNVYVHEFDQIPIKPSNNQTGKLQEFQSKIQAELKKQQAKKIPIRQAKKNIKKNNQMKPQLKQSIQKEKQVKEVRQQAKLINEQMQIVQPNQRKQIPKKKMKLSLISKSIRDSTIQEQISQSIQSQIKNLQIQQGSKIGESGALLSKNIQTEKKSNKPEINITIRPFQKKQLPKQQVQTTKIKINKHVEVQQLLNVYNSTYEMKKRQMDMKFEAMKRKKLSNK